MHVRKFKFLLMGLMLFSALPLYLRCSGKPTPVAAEQSQTAPVYIINSQEAKEIIAQNPDIILLDVRTPQEYAGGHLQQAQLLNFNAPDFQARIKQLDPAKTYLVYCAVGGRSKQASDFMQKTGFKKVYTVSQGFNALKQAGIPVE